LSSKGLHVGVPLDLSQYTDLGEALSEAASYRVGFMTLVSRALKEDNTQRQFGLGHMFLLSALARAAGLHDAIHREIEQANPHAVISLERTYVELGVTLAYVNERPDYINVIVASGGAQTRRGQRRTSIQAMCAVAAKRYPGVKRVYDELSEFGHFGATGVWASWAAGGVEEWEGETFYRLGPGWRDSERDPLLAAAMLAEMAHVTHTEATRFLETYLLPLNRAWSASGEGQ
jgi:hypothetical protein